MTTLLTKYPVHTLVPHQRPHADEMAIFLMAQKLYSAQAEKLYPGISRAQIKEFNRDQLGSKSSQQWLEEGYLLVGIGNGRYDEHASMKARGKTREKPKDCAATLFAKDIGVYEQHECYRFIQHIFKNDTDGAQSLMDICSLLNLWYDFGKPFQFVYAEFCKYALLLIRNDELIHTEGKREWEAHGRIETIAGPSGTKLTMAVVQSDSNYVLPYVDSKFSGVFPDIKVLWKSTGHCLIFCTTHKRKNGATGKRIPTGLRLNKVVANIRRHVLQKRGSGYDPQSLSDYGQADNTEMIMYHPDFEAMFNGTKTESSVVPIGDFVSLDELLEAVRKGMRDFTFRKSSKK